ncbi:transcriptional regulator family: Fungal Specific TF [Paecilomyces variotii]|nr:transcriptional regulator family: Fungal Specific TF [Paecilomyces variotii]
MQSAISKDSTPADQSAALDPTDKAKRTVAKRVRRACDRCRLKKWKCDGESPCRPCDLRGLDCSYYESSRRRSRPEYIEHLETQLFYLKTIFRTVWPSIDVDRLISEKNPEQLLEEVTRNTRWSTEEVSGTLRSLANGDGGRGIFLDTMIERGGCRKGGGAWCNTYHSHCGRLALLCTIRDRCSQMLTNSLQQILLQMDLREAFGWHRSISPFHLGNRIMSDTGVLPTKSRAKELVSIAVENAFCLLTFIHRPSCDRAIDRLYEDSANGISVTEDKELPLLISLCALGELFSGGEDRSEEYFRLARQLLDFAVCRDISSLQAILTIAIYLQSRSMALTCRDFVSAGVAAMRRVRETHCIEGTEDPIAKEVLKRSFWTLWTLDVYLTRILGLPRLVDEDITDLDLPSEVEDDPSSRSNSRESRENLLKEKALLTAANAHTRLTMIQERILKCIYPVDEYSFVSENTFRVNYQVVLSIEKELEAWFSEVSRMQYLRVPNDDIRRAEILLLIAHCRVQMALYLPFLHHIRKPSSGENSSQIHSFACAMACIKAAMQEVSLAVQLQSQGLLAGCYWFLPSVTFTAVMTLLMSVLANRRDPKAYEKLDAAEKGTNVLVEITSSSQPFRECLNILMALIGELKAGLNIHVISPESGTSSVTNLDITQVSVPTCEALGTWPVLTEPTQMSAFMTDLDADMYNNRFPFAPSAFDLYDAINGSGNPPYNFFGPGGAYIE